MTNREGGRETVLGVGAVGWKRQQLCKICQFAAQRKGQWVQQPEETMLAEGVEIEGNGRNKKSRHLSGPISCAFLLLPQVSDKKRMKEVAAEVRYKPRFALLEREIKGWKKSRHFTP